jgi:hypothetical protein
MIEMISVFRAAAFFLLVIAAPVSATESEPAADLAWSNLIPQVPQPVQTMKAKSFLAGTTPFAGAGGSEPPPPPTMLKVASQYTGLAETGYTIDADKVETRKE